MILVSAAIIRDGEKVLITQRLQDKPLGGLWEFPGGKVEDGEVPEECLVREIQEEIGVDIDIIDIFSVVHHLYDHGSFLILVYDCTLAAGDINHLEVADHRWLYPDQIDCSVMLPADIPIVEKLVKMMADE